MAKGFMMLTVKSDAIIVEVIKTIPPIVGVLALP
jgi:hypothetical protein